MFLRFVGVSPGETYQRIKHELQHTDILPTIFLHSPITS